MLTVVKHLGYIESVPIFMHKFLKAEIKFV